MFLRSPNGGAVAALAEAAAIPERESGSRAGMIMPAALEALGAAERYGFAGDALAAWFALQLASDESAFGLACETGRPSPSLSMMAELSLLTVRDIYSRTRAEIMCDPALEAARPLLDYEPSHPASRLDGELRAMLADIASALASPENAGDLRRALERLYMSRGCGIFALNAAFRVRGGLLEPIAELDDARLDDLIGCDQQIAELRACVTRFVSGAAPNNVLLYGDSGTGKSTSVRALLNEPGLVARGLRIVEFRKDQFRELPDILSMMSGRAHRFILFMDDLSFEESETDYKYLKAAIEGGLGRKPDNAAIYATSNRRNIIREVWAERGSCYDDVHASDTMQEKLSLADRFGVTIWYSSAPKDIYLEIVRKLAAERGIRTPREELERLAMRWELEKGGFTGRTARQFVQSLEADEKGDEAAMAEKIDRKKLVADLENAYREVMAYICGKAGVTASGLGEFMESTGEGDMVAAMFGIREASVRLTISILADLSILDSPAGKKIASAIGKEYDPEDEPAWFGEFAGQLTVRALGSAGQDALAVPPAQIMGGANFKNLPPNKSAVSSFSLQYDVEGTRVFINTSIYA